MGKFLKLISFALLSIATLALLENVLVYHNLARYPLELIQRNFQKNDVIQVDTRGAQLVRGDIKDGDLSYPSDIELSVFADGLGKVRVLYFDSRDTLYATIIDQGKVVAFIDNNKDGKVDNTITILSGLNQPHGLQLMCFSNIEKKCMLFLAETDKVSKYDLDMDTHQVSNQTILFSLPAGELHYTRTIKIVRLEKEFKLLTSVGSSCNACKEDNKFRSKILISNLDGSNLQVYSSGLRNSVFITQDPNSDKIFATEMGRDWLGDSVPPDEINLIEQGKFYGWPYCYGDGILDASVENSQSAQDACDGSTKPLIKIPAHSAPLGIAFFPDSWGEKYKNTLLVAYHGSTNRTEPTGYKIVTYKMNNDLTAVESSSDFISGWLKDKKVVLGRPVTFAFNAKGELYISDDHTGKIYRVVKK